MLVRTLLLGGTIGALFGASVAFSYVRTTPASPVAVHVLAERTPHNTSPTESLVPTPPAHREVKPKPTEAATPPENTPATKPDTARTTPATASPTTRDSEHADVVPFFSQFSDISSAKWRTVGCGVASLAMLIDYYVPKSVTVDELLDEGLAAGAYLDSAGWIHQGLIDIARNHGLDGNRYDLSGSSMGSAFSTFENMVRSGPVMASVHYTFEPTNPIPHLVVINRIDGDTVYYNDPSETAGNGSISTEKFKRAWKQMFIVIRPTA